MLMLIFFKKIIFSNIDPSNTVSSIFLESLLKEYKTKTQDYDQLQAKLKELEGAEAKLKEHDSLVERLKALEEKGS